jgi:nucleoside-diphosphate-sugar epimerase
VGERVLVTGATGFIGSHLVDELLWKGYEVTALIRTSSDLRWLRGKGVKFIHGDLLGKGKLPSLKGFAYIFHLGGATKALRRRGFYRVNQEGTKRLIAAAGKFGGSSALSTSQARPLLGPLLRRGHRRRRTPRVRYRRTGRASYRGRRRSSIAAIRCR